MEKEFIPYELALELKQLGFDETCFGYYEPNKEFKYINWEIFKDFPYLAKNSEWEDLVAAPTYSQAFRWFREKHNLEYQIMKSANGNYSAVIHLNTQEYLEKISTLHHACVDEVVDCYSYEEAELECLKKLIEIVNNETKWSIKQMVSQL
jgi:hypothetical protein